uniref:Transcription factor TFIIIC triple barrel domain-containing protein n=1 Tax=Panagrolaimus superbus TaxID=310955 RepID=A0A914YVA4_9BILA
MPPKRSLRNSKKAAPTAGVPEPDEDVEMEETATTNPASSSSTAAPPSSSSAAKTQSKFAALAQETVKNLLAGPPKPSGQASSKDTVINHEVLIQSNEAEVEEATDAAAEIEENEDDDWLSSDEVEDTYVVVDLHGFIDQKIIHERVTENLCKVRNPETPNPVIQIGGQLFSGKYKESDGSIIIIEQHNEIGNKTFTLTGVTDTIMEARKTYLYAKGEEHESVPGETLRKPITMKLEQLSNKALPTYFKKKV